MRSIFDYTVPGVVFPDTTWSGAPLERCLLSRFYSIIIKAGDTGATHTLVMIALRCIFCHGHSRWVALRAVHVLRGEKAAFLTYILSYSSNLPNKVLMLKYQSWMK